MYKKAGLSIAKARVLECENPGFRKRLLGLFFYQFKGKNFNNKKVKNEDNLCNIRIWIMIPHIFGSSLERV